MRIIPAIDIIEGKCVRLSQGDYQTKKIYSENPLEMALRLEAHGIGHLHLVDLDGAKAKHVVNYKILEQISSKTDLKIDFGGGIKSDKDLAIAFECGAKQITAGSVAVKDPALVASWLESLGSDKIILGADIAKGKIAVQGWTEKSELELLPFLENYFERGIRSTICTDISRDGMLAGPSFKLYEEVIQSFSGLSLIASGGIASMEDIFTLEKSGCEGAILGKAIYEERITLKQLERYILNN